MKTENDRYRDEHYPHLKPCMGCYYWRGANCDTRSQSFPMCHYLSDHNEVRGCEPDYINETCGKFKPREKRPRKNLYYMAGRKK